MPEYEFQCPVCRARSTLFLSPTANDDLQRQPCGCGAMMERVFEMPQVGYMDWVNPERGDGLNMGLPIKRDANGRIRNFKSAKEREDWAKQHGLEKLDR